MSIFKGPRGKELLQGELITLAASAARTANGNGSWFYIGGERSILGIVLDITASATDAGDTLDVYIDFSFDGTNAIGNAVHFAQQAGNGAAARYYAMLMPTSGLTTPTTITSDASAGVVRPELFGPYIRARWAIADSGNGNSSHTFSVQAWAV